MSDQMKIDVALANLEAGKFSFRMIDAIKDHISTLENELEVVRSLHDSAIRDLKRQELANWRQEGELRKLNAKIYALLKANLLTEKAYAGMTPVVVKMGEYFEVSKKFAAAALERAMAHWKTGKLQSQCLDAAAKIYALLTANAYAATTFVAMKIGAYFEASKKFAEPALERAMADLKSGKLQSRSVDAAAKLYALLKEIMPTKSALRKMKPYAHKMGEYLAVIGKYVGAHMAKASAYLSTLHKNAA